MPGTPNSAQFLLGSAAGSGATPAYGADVVINNINHNYILNSSFLYIYNSAGVGPVYNYQKNISAALLNGELKIIFMSNSTPQPTRTCHGLQ